jgi:hypothetical protein
MTKRETGNWIESTEHVWARHAMMRWICISADAILARKLTMKR